MIFRVNTSSGAPVYLQLMDQVKHAVDTGALRAGEQLPTIRRLAEELVVNPNTVVRAYRELQHAGVIELRHGSGAFISDSRPGAARVSPRAQAIVESAVGRLVAAGLTEEEIRRLFEHELGTERDRRASGRHHG
jgi:GntR family transcriptional regulator